ncbi:hypothetical protein DJ030_07065 [bacterium endosymbiont of Escarpia laminata]|nr:MAG: hypothetical protein DJ031_08545 [bacterium endosymbiont of Escarpia laminata]RLJ20262.1 MAG: hypothetical protein DJ030_07065 [bacterium endosymbiont of Escarpia laminata]
MHIFAYGSLINLDSASKAVGYSVNKSDVISAKLTGFKRTWDLVDTVYSNSLCKNVNAVFLNLTASTGMFVNGILISIKEKELSSIAKREKNYDIVDVSSKVYFSECGCKQQYPHKNIYTAIAKEQFKIANENNTFFLDEYEKLVMKGVVSFGKQFLEEYLNTTETSNLKKLNGHYEFVNPLQNSLA